MCEIAQTAHPAHRIINLGMLSGDSMETEALTMRCPTCGAGPQVLCDRVEVGGVRPLSHLERRRIAGQGGPLHNFEMLSGDSIETEALTMRCPTCGAGPQVLCDRVEVGGVRPLSHLERRRIAGQGGPQNEIGAAKK